MFNEGMNDDFYAFSANNLIIRSKNKHSALFSFNKEQIFINKIINEQKKTQKKVRIIILKGRQIGSTTLCAARGYYLTIHNRGYRSFVLSHRRSATNNIFDIISRYHNNMPSSFDNKASVLKYKSIEFNGLDSSYLFATAGSNEVGRGETIQFFHGSEVAFWKNGDNHLASVLMAVPEDDNTEIFLESTSNGPFGTFYELCMDAQNNKSDYQLIFLPWWWHDEYRVYDKNIVLSKSWLDYGRLYNLDEYQIKWAYLKNKMLNISNNSDKDGPCIRFYQEFPANVSEAFKFSSFNNLIKLDDLLKSAYDVNFTKANGVIDLGLKKKFSQSTEPLIFGVDVATGGGDLSWIIDRKGSFLGFNINEYRNFGNTMEIVGWIHEKIKKYNPHRVYIDAGGGGIGVYDRLVELGFSQIVFLVYFASKSNDDRKYLNKRSEMWCKLRDFIGDDDNVIIQDPVLLHQISAVEYTYNSKGQIQLEAKEKLKARLKSSPDGADACALTFADIDNNAHIYKLYSQTNIHNHDFNPFNW